MFFFELYRRRYWWGGVVNLLWHMTAFNQSDYSMDQSNCRTALTCQNKYTPPPHQYGRPFQYSEFWIVQYPRRLTLTQSGTGTVPRKQEQRPENVNCGTANGHNHLLFTLRLPVPVWKLCPCKDNDVNKVESKILNFCSVKLKQNNLN